MTCETQERLRDALSSLKREEHNLSLFIKKLQFYENIVNNLTQEVYRALHEHKLQDKAVQTSRDSTREMQGSEGVRPLDGDGDGEIKSND